MFEEFEIKVVTAIISVLNVFFTRVLGLCGEFFIFFLNPLNLINVILLSFFAEWQERLIGQPTTTNMFQLFCIHPRECYFLFKTDSAYYQRTVVQVIILAFLANHSSFSHFKNDTQCINVPLFLCSNRPIHVDYLLQHNPASRAPSSNSHSKPVIMADKYHTFNLVSSSQIQIRY